MHPHNLRLSKPTDLQVAGRSAFSFTGCNVTVCNVYLNIYIRVSFSFVVCVAVPVVLTE